MFDDDIKEKLFMVFVMVILAISFIIHIPKYIETWKNNGKNNTDTRTLRKT